MENFISGYPGCEFQIRETLAEVIGEEKATFFFDKVCPSPLSFLSLPYLTFTPLTPPSSS